MAFTPYVIPMAAVLVFVMAGWGYVFLRKERPRGTVGLLFFLFGLDTLFFTLTDIRMRLSDSPEEAMFWWRLVISNTLFAPLLVHYSYVFPRRKRCPVDPRIPISIAYGVGAPLVLVQIAFAEHYTREIRLFPWGYQPTLGTPFQQVPLPMSIAFALFLLILAWGAYNLLHSFLRAPNRLERIQVGLLFLGIPASFALYILFSIALPSQGIYTPLMGSAMLFFSMPFLSLAILRYKIFATPVYETPSQAPARHTLPPGHLYLAKEERPRRSLEVFTDLATHDTHGLAITRTPPQTIRDEWHLEKTPILWLGEKPPTPDIPAVDSIEELYYNIGEFLRKSQNSVILIDGLEYLIQTHDFNKVLRMLYRLKEQMVAHHSRMILPVDPRTLQEREMALLERETEGLR